MTLPVTGSITCTPCFSHEAFFLLCYRALLPVNCPLRHQLATVIPLLALCFPFFSSSPPGPGSVTYLPELLEPRAEAMFTFIAVRWGKVTVGELSAGHWEVHPLPLISPYTVLVCSAFYLLNSSFR